MAGSKVRKWLSISCRSPQGWFGASGLLTWSLGILKGLKRFVVFGSRFLQGAGLGKLYAQTASCPRCSSTSNRHQSLASADWQSFSPQVSFAQRCAGHAHLAGWQGPQPAGRAVCESVLSREVLHPCVQACKVTVLCFLCRGVAHSILLASFTRRLRVLRSFEA